MDSNSRKETGDMKDVAGSKDGRDQSEKESKVRSACVSEDIAAKRPKFSLGTNFIIGSEQDEDSTVKLSPANSPVYCGEIVRSVDAAELAAREAALADFKNAASSAAFFESASPAAIKALQRALFNVRPPDSGNNIGCSLGVDVPQNDPSLDPTQTPPAIIKVTEDMSLLLVPRIKLNFILGCTSGSIGDLMRESTVKNIVTSYFRHPRLVSNKPLIIHENDVHFHYASEPKWTDEDMFVVAEGYVFVRNAKPQDKKVVVLGRDFLLQRMSTFKYNLNGACYELRLSLPLGEDADKMMASIPKTQIVNTGPSQELPTIMMKGLPFHWFAEQPGSSKPSEPLLRHFFESFDSVRKLVVVDDGVVIQFKDCYKALQSLCSCSLQKEGSHEMADYTIMWKDQGVCFDASQEASSVPACVRFKEALNGRMIVSPPKKKMLKEKANDIEFHISKLEEEWKAIKTRVREFVEELDHLRT